MKNIYQLILISCAVLAHKTPVRRNLFFLERSTIIQKKGTKLIYKAENLISDSK